MASVAGRSAGTTTSPGWVGVMVSRIDARMRPGRSALRSTSRFSAGYRDGARTVAQRQSFTRGSRRRRATDTGDADQQSPFSKLRSGGRRAPISAVATSTVAIARLAGGSSKQRRSEASMCLRLEGVATLRRTRGVRLARVCTRRGGGLAELASRRADRSGAHSCSSRSPRCRVQVQIENGLGTPF